ncbi:hypothetical protein MBLNU457_3163t1 [Dothideomycetes sp. NU457]
MSGVPAEPPPPYHRVDPKSTGHDPGPSHLLEPRNGIPPDARRSMEDEHRPLPEGWVRQYDRESNHQFFVDTRKDPPRSIWQHPYDDEEYLSSLPSAERERLQEMTRHSSVHDIMAEPSDDEDAHHPTKSGALGGASSSHAGSSKHDQQLPPREEKRTWGRKMKDKITHSTHEEREAERRRRAEEERRIYEQHMVYRRAMVRAMETGQPQFIGKDHQGKDVYVEPPRGGGYGGYGGYPGGMYAAPNARYIRPQNPYARPYGYGYGGGYGLPLAGGLMGGMLLGGLMF